jgi:peptidoglycan/xylan/chitin deacetylase (PgdA/CDA1 family)
MSPRTRSLFLIVCLFALLTANLSAVGAQSAAPFRVYLTFEDGPTQAYTPQILDTLAQYNAKASFLIGGYQIAGNEALLQREVLEGHAIVNHLWDEPGHYAGTDEDGIRESYLRTETAIRAALGDALPIYESQQKLFWQPGGGSQPLPAIEGVSVITYNMNVDADDCGWWLPDDIDLDTFEFDEAVIQNVLGQPVSQGGLRWNAYQYGDGVIIAFHDINRVTPRVLPTILAELQAAGATFHALPRPGDVSGTMPVQIGVPPLYVTDPAAVPGTPGTVLPALVRDEISRIRTAPSLNSDVLFGGVTPDTTLTAIGRVPGWIQVQYEGQTGWIADFLVDVRGPIPNLPLASS